MNNHKIEFILPGWLNEDADRYKGQSKEDRMRFVIDLARKNIDTRNGGPFGAAIYEVETGKLVAPGINMVERSNCSILHAEIVAIILAQKRIGTYNLKGPDMPRLELVTSVEPCAMCLGAVQWAGISRLISGARGEDAESIGFDEGYKGAGWIDALKQRDIEVVLDICRNEAKGILQAYKEMEGTIYNAGRRSDR